ncbi:DUF5132 domain-containing protein [Pantanalinema rosaneae CENA516]|uniref:DUF5132 domain-containing protein n=1 Tax=Pantanalinema rosaneae TaxID=1620701 RepID=UPI003D6E44CC
MSMKLVPEFKEIAEKLGVPGIAAIVLLPVLVPGVGRVVKPAAKAAIKGGILLYERGKGMFTEMGEGLEDMIAEAKAELAAAQEKTTAIDVVSEATEA